MAYEIRLRKGDSGSWIARNPLLALGEPGYETDTGKCKIGNGADLWLSLPYFIDEEAIAILIEEAALEGPVGPQGPPGSNGTNGTNGTNGVDGSDGVDGEDGVDGLSAYQIAVNNGFVGNEAAWLASLVGPAGTNGTNGSNGANGSNGQSVTVTLVAAADWPPAADSDPLHLYFRVP